MSSVAASPSETRAPGRIGTPRPNASNASGRSDRALVVAPNLARRRLRARLAMWAGAAVTVLALFTLVQFHVLAAQSAFTLEKLEKERTNEQFRYQRLREQVARSSSAQHVRAEAAKLGMIPGTNLVQLEVPYIAPTTPVSDTIPEPLSAEDYADTKPSLGTNP